MNNNILKFKVNAFGACFATLESFKNITLFFYTKKEYINNNTNEFITKLYIVELSKNDDNNNNNNNNDDEKICNNHNYHIRVEKKVEFHHSNDFVVNMVQCKYVLYAVTKLGCLLIFNISSGICLYNERVSRDVIFLVTKYLTKTINGIVALDRTGKLTLYYLNNNNNNNINNTNNNNDISILNHNKYNNSFCILYKNKY